MALAKRLLYASRRMGAFPVARLKCYNRVADVTFSARIVIGDRDLKNAKVVVEEIKKAGGYGWRLFLSGITRH